MSLSPLLFPLCILEFRKVTRTEVSINDLSSSTSIFAVCLLFIFAVCLLAFEQYLVKWECTLGAIALQEIIISARYPAEISFLILFYWKKSSFFIYSILTWFCVPTVYETPWATSPSLDSLWSKCLELATCCSGDSRREGCAGFPAFEQLSLATSSTEQSVLKCLKWHFTLFLLSFNFHSWSRAQLLRCYSCIRH